MAAIEALEDIKELNSRHAAIEIEQMLSQQREQSKQYELMKKQLEKDEDEAEIRCVGKFHPSNAIELVLVLRNAFGKSLVPADADELEDEETVETIEETLPLSLSNTKARVSPRLSFSSLCSHPIVSVHGLVLSADQCKEAHRKEFAVHGDQEEAYHYGRCHSQTIRWPQLTHGLL